MNRGAVNGSDSTLRFMLRAFRSRNYRLFFTGQLASLLGTWLSMTATSWLVYRLALKSMPKDTALLLGVVAFAGQIPVFLLAPWAGVWIDRWSRHKVLLVTQTLSMLQSFALAILALTGWVQIWHVMALNAFQGIVNAFDITARQTFIVEMVDDRADLSGAIALNSSMFHSARLVGPAIAGWIIAATNEGICFLLDGFSYLGVLIALLAMRLPPHVRVEQHPPAAKALLEGLRYCFGFTPIRLLLSLIAVNSLMAAAQSVLMPLFANNPQRLGYMLGAAGCGAFVGSLYLASRRSVLGLGLGRVIASAAALLGISMMAFSFAGWPLWLMILPVLGGALVVQVAASNTLLQTIADDDKRARVMSMFAMAVMGMAPFGSLISGTTANYVGPEITMLLAGCVSVAAAVTFAIKLPGIRPLIRPIYVRKGILPEIAEGMQSASNLGTTPHE